MFVSCADILDHNEKITLALFWSLIFRYQIVKNKHGSGDQGKITWFCRFHFVDRFLYTYLNPLWSYSENIKMYTASNVC